MGIFEVESQEILQSIAIIDDDASLLSKLKTSLQKILKNPQIHTFREGPAAWTFFSENKVDLIILDWILPDLSGLAIFNRLRGTAAYRYTPITVISGNIQAQDFSLMDELPFTGPIEKPLNGFFMKGRDAAKVWPEEKKAVTWAVNKEVTP